MAATVEIRSYHGTSSPDAGANVAGSSMRFKQENNDTVDANNPIPIPGAGTNYSYIKQLRFYAATSPSNVINNLKFYTDGTPSFGTGVGMTTKTEAGWVNPVTQGASQMTGATDAFTYTSGSALAVTGSCASTATGAFGDYVKLQMTVGTSATQGTTNSENITFSYDES